MPNIVLIGLSGCGKSTIAKYLEKNFRFAMIDVDELIEERLNMKISEIFQTKGENFFRLQEHIITCEVAKLNHTVIATGGGVVLNELNMQALVKNGLIFFLDREPAEILNSANLSNRPLLQNDKNKLFDLYKTRKDLYNKYADFKVSEFEDIEKTAQFIINTFEKHKDFA